MMNFKITHVQIFDYKEQRQTSENDNFETIHNWGANVIINDDFVVQIGTNGSIDVPRSCECFWNSEEKQNWAAETEEFDLDDIIDQTNLNADRDWLLNQNFTTEIMNPENKPN